MSDHGEFTPVSDAREYMNAPAMIMNGSEVGGDPAPPRMPLILKAAVEFSSSFEILSADELQQYYAEQSSLQRRLTELVNRLDVELKMREAANSISRLHAGDVPAEAKATHRASFSSNRSSILGGLNTTSPKSNRLSRLLGSDSQQKSEKRLSKQAADEAAVSTKKIWNLEQLRAEIERRKYTVDCTITQHHAAVMARALTSKPLPNYHQRSRSGASVMSGQSQTSSRQSWIMAPKHQRQWSSNSNGDAASLATVTEHERMPSRGTPGPSSANDEELNALVSRIAQVLPQDSPQPQGKASFIGNAFDRLFRDLTETRNALEASRVEIDNSEQRVQHLLQQQEASTNGSRAVSSSADEVTLTQLKYELAEERATAGQWRERAEQQRMQLEATVRSLEDVTRLTVRLEGERSEFEQLLRHLETKVSSLEADKVQLLQQKLSSAPNTSLLLREFQEIIADLVARHEREVRQLYPAFARQRPETDGLEGGAQAQTQLLSAQQSSAHLPNAPQNRPPSAPHFTEDGLEEGGGQQYTSQREYAMNAMKPSRNSSRQVSPHSPPQAHPQPKMQPATEATTQSQLSPQSVHSSHQSLTSPHPSTHSGRYSLPSPHHSLRSPQSVQSPLESMSPSSIQQSPIVTQAPPPGASYESKRPLSKVPDSLSVPDSRTAPDANRLSLSSDALRRPISVRSDDHDLAHPQATLDNSYDDSIQHTNDSLMYRPQLDRQNTENSEFSKSSSYYPEAASANQSQASIAAPNRSQPYLPQPYEQSQTKYEPYEPTRYSSAYDPADELM